MTGYRLGPWRSYRHETGIIRTSRTWWCATWKFFHEKWPVATLPNKNVMTLIFYGKIFCIYFAVHFEHFLSYLWLLLLKCWTVNSSLIICCTVTFRNSTIFDLFIISSLKVNSRLEPKTSYLQLKYFEL
jgi:hypothetical protein